MGHLLQGMLRHDMIETIMYDGPSGCRSAGTSRSVRVVMLCCDILELVAFKRNLVPV